MTRTGDRGTPEKLNLCKAGLQLPNTCTLLENKSYKFLPGEKTWKSTSRKLLSVTLCHVLFTAVRSRFLRILLRYLDQVQAGPPTPLSWNRRNYFCLKQRTPVCVTTHVSCFFYRHTQSMAALAHRNLHQFGYPVTTAMFRSATKQTHCILFISNVTPHAVNCRSVPFLGGGATMKFSKFFFLTGLLADETVSAHFDATTTLLRTLSTSEISGFKAATESNFFFVAI